MSTRTRVRVRCRACGKTLKVRTTYWNIASRLLHVVPHQGCQALGPRQLVKALHHVRP